MIASPDMALHRLASVISSEHWYTMPMCSGSHSLDARLAIEHPLWPIIIDSDACSKPTLSAPEPTLLILGSQSCLAGSHYCNGPGACSPHNYTASFREITSSLSGCERGNEAKTRRIRELIRSAAGTPTPTCYLITSSARKTKEGGKVRPKACAVFRLMINLRCVGCSTGISAGLVPRRTLATSVAARRYRSATLGP
jgi:hypothetical protein